MDSFFNQGNAIRLGIALGATLPAHLTFNLLQGSKADRANGVFKAWSGALAYKGTLTAAWVLAGFGAAYYFGGSTYKSNILAAYIGSLLFVEADHFGLTGPIHEYF